MTWPSAALADSPLFLAALGTDIATDESGNGRTASMYPFGIVPDAAWLDVGATLSIEAWITLTAAGLNMIAAREGAAARSFQFRTNGGNLEFVKVTGAVTVSTATSINDGNEHYVCITYDNANIRLYKDSSTPLITTAATGVMDGAQGLQIGFRANSTIATPANPFIGRIRGLGYYGSTLSAARIDAHIADGPPASPAADGVWGLVS